MDIKSKTESAKWYSDRASACEEAALSNENGAKTHLALAEANDDDEQLDKAALCERRAAWERKRAESEWRDCDSILAEIEYAIMAELVTSGDDPETIATLKQLMAERAARR